MICLLKLFFLSPIYSFPTVSVSVFSFRLFLLFDQFLSACLLIHPFTVIIIFLFSVFGSFISFSFFSLSLVCFLYCISVPLFLPSRDLFFYRLGTFSSSDWSTSFFRFFFYFFNSPFISTTLLMHLSFSLFFLTLIHLCLPKVLTSPKKNEPSWINNKSYSSSFNLLSARLVKRVWLLKLKGLKESENIVMKIIFEFCILNYWIKCSTFTS